MDLSLCMIVKNEEASLPQVLESVQPVVDEMVILDTGSSDRTVDIATDYGARVYHFQWCNDFSAARNHALQYVRGKWVLVLDADEVLTPKIVPEIQQAIKNDRNLVINLIRQEVGATQSPYSLVSRLFRHHPDLYFSRPYHSLVDDSVSQLVQREPDWQVISLSTVGILHYGYQPSAIASLDKYTRAKKAMEGFLADHPNDPYLCSKLGALYVRIGKVEEGISLLKRGFTDSQVDAAVLFELHYHLGNAYRKQNQLQLAADHYQDAIQQPILSQLKLGAYNNLGNLLFSVGDLTTAKRAYQTTVNIDPSFAMGYNHLGMTLKALGQWEAAITAYQKAIQLNPDYADAYQNLGVVLFKLGRIPESSVAFESAIARHQVTNPQEAQRLRQELQGMGLR
ncbi:tetratricopeptide repeat protein [Coleofasciculus sp. F4-SAH-05]|uniref:tetratricopeptide repeat protein n=1 Tax=Coleofasciculus sp. F4-SAH-05 TaxID=3069525 RepID=UPI003302F51E